MNLQRLTSLSPVEAEQELAMFGSYERTEAMVHVMLKMKNPADRVRVFLNRGNMCDAPWRYRSLIADILREACAEVVLADVLPRHVRRAYNSLPEQVPIWRGCEHGRVRGLHWTMDKVVAEKFAKGRRCSNQRPQAQVPKRHILAIFLDRHEREIIVDPRRLRRVLVEPYRDMQ